MFGPCVHIHGGNHIFDCPGRYMDSVHNKSEYSNGNVHIEEDCWIGANSIILKGVTTGMGSIVGVGSVVVHDVPAMSVACGNPAKAIKKRYADKEDERR